MIILKKKTEPIIEGLNCKVRFFIFRFCLASLNGFLRSIDKRLQTKPRIEG